MIQLTPGAANAVRSALAGATEPMEGLRIMVESGGCAGLKYKMGLVAEALPEDVMFESEGVKVFIEPRSVDVLEGTVIDFVVSLEGSGFTFDNPQAQSSCSCGKSFR